MDYKAAAIKIVSRVKKLNKDFKVPEVGSMSPAEMPAFDNTPTGKPKPTFGDGNDKEPGGTQSYHGNTRTYLGNGSGPTYGETQGGNWS